MPGLSGTGPTGKGPRTGRGLGPCIGGKPKPKVVSGKGRARGGKGRAGRGRFGPAGLVGRGFLKGNTGF